MVSQIETNGAPKPIGPYSQAIKVESGSALLFVSGQIPLDPATGSIVEGGIVKQTHQSLKNIEAILATAGCDKSQVVKVEIFLTDLSLFSLVNEVYGQWLEGAAPARQTIEVSALPAGALIEISCTAVL
ncbi:MAG: Rid family detoxifying hydrolase [Chlamydiia bacterium]|nr:Rid family detoxifying hydrolase [Chlamydiia bacterium]